MRLAEALGDLRKRYWGCKGPRALEDVAAEMGVSRQTLARFGRGSAASAKVLAAIEAWVEKEEQESERRRQRLHPSG